MVQLILSAFEAHREEKKIAQKIRAEFDKNHGKFHSPAHLIAIRITLHTKCRWRVFECLYFDFIVGESWNCIVGKNFGSHVIHQTEGYLFCSYRGEMNILLWKSGWRALFSSVLCGVCVTSKAERLTISLRIFARNVLWRPPIFFWGNGLILTDKLLFRNQDGPNSS